MSSMVESTVREKKFDLRISRSKRVHHTMTDDFTLFMLHRNREKLERGEPLEQTNWLKKFVEWWT